MLVEILIVLGLIALNGALAMSELAIVSARPARLKSLEARHRGAATALRLAEHPGRFLSSVQIGITLVGVLSGAFSGATLGQRLAGFLREQGLDAELAGTLGVGGVVVVLTYVSLIAGELVPKQLALRNPEGVAMRVAPAMRLLATMGAPLVWLLDRSGKAVLWLIGQGGQTESKVTDEEVRVILSEAHEGGVIETEEREMMAGVMRLADRTARALMTPRHEIEMLSLDAPSAEVAAAFRRLRRARLPVGNPETGEVAGIVTMADAFAQLSQRKRLVPRELLRDVPVVSDMADAFDVMEVLRTTPEDMALVYDEYGHFEGIITPGDILEAITGSMVGSSGEEPAMVARADGGFLVAGWMPVDEFCDRMELPRAVAGDYDTVAGLVLHQLRRLPQLGDHFMAEGVRFEVVDLDGMRIDKVLVERR